MTWSASSATTPMLCSTSTTVRPDRAARISSMVRRMSSTPIPALGPQTRRVLAEDDDPTGGRPEESGEEVEEARLPRPVRTDERVNLSGLEPQVHAVDRTEAGELLDEPVGLDRVGRQRDGHIRVLRPAQYGSRMTRFSVFPAALRGKSSTTTTSCTCW